MVDVLPDGCLLMGPAGMVELHCEVTWEDFNQDELALYAEHGEGGMTRREAEREYCELVIALQG